ncbi:MAG: UbiA family prenyltransferase [Chloroflexota bacterium]
MAARAAGLIRLGHPFPSLLDGVVVAGIALIAAGDLGLAARLGGSMTALQASIGALNDLRDAPADAGRKPGKPIPAGLVAVPVARAVVVTAAAAGVALAAPSGPGLVALALLVLAIGYAYDLAAKGTPWSWVPFALGIPILPLYGWLGASDAVPGWLVALVPIAAIAGGAIAIANARADLERDETVGQASVATSLGLEDSWRVSVVLVVGAMAAAAAWLATTGDSPPPILAVIGLLAGLLVTAAGLVVGRRAAPARRERAWQLVAVGIAVFGIGWVAAAAS